jgi:hypothetical protein
MAINSKYNGWPAKVRKFRGNKFYSQMHQGKIPKPVKCAACGAEGGGMTYHAEEYGPTWEEYVAGTKPLCNYCHGMMHVRFKYPNRFKRYLRRVSEGHTFFVFGHLGAFFKAMAVYSDIPEEDYVPSGVEWLDAISLTPYTGEDKVATIIVSGNTLPDPKIYNNSEQKQILEDWK